VDTPHLVTVAVTPTRAGNISQSIACSWPGHRLDRWWWMQGIIRLSGCETVVLRSGWGPVHTDSCVTALDMVGCRRSNGAGERPIQ